MQDQVSNIEQLIQDDKQYIWHPFTQMQDYMEEEPVIIAEGDGNYLQDIDGNRYLDGVSSLWTNVHGHRKAALDQALKDQVDRIAHSTMLGLSNVPAIQCARKLVEIAPEGLSKVFYSDSGSTAVEIALKIAFQYQQQAAEGDSQKKKFISFKNAYHGDTIGSVSVGGIDLFHNMYKQLLFESIKVPAPYCYRCHLGRTYPECTLACLQQLEETMEQHHQEVAALVIEPLVQGASGILLQPEGYLKKVRELCTRYNVLMIADEVAVGFGKTGSMFACQQEQVVPDIMAVAKGISGGYLPLAATLVQEKIYRGFLATYEEFKTFFHGHTYTGNPLACAVALASMRLFEEEDILENLQPKIALLTEKLAELKELSHVGDIRQRGIMVGIELVKDSSSKEDYPAAQKIGHKVILAAREQGVMIRPLGNVIVLMPPLSITREEIIMLCNVVADSIRSVTEKAGA